jgi:hypothetical protein
MRTKIVGALVIVGSLANVARTRDAGACVPLLCEQAQVAPAASAAVPRHVLGIPYTPTRPAPTAAMTFHLLDSSNVEVPTTTVADPWDSGSFLLTPSADLASGSGYHIAYQETCTNTGIGAAFDRTSSFTAGPDTKLPTDAGSLGGAGRTVGQLAVFNSAGSCTAEIQAVSMDLRITASPELLAYAPLAGFMIQVDTTSPGRLSYGKAKIDGGDLVLERPYAACGARDPANDNGLELGTHTFTVTAHIAGAPTDPPAITTQLDFSCGSFPGDGGYDPSDTGIGLPADSGRPSDEAGVNNLTPGTGSTSGCACTTTPKPPLAGDLAIFFATSSFFAFFRSRRRAKHDSP